MTRPTAAELAKAGIPARAPRRRRPAGEEKLALEAKTARRQRPAA